MTSVAMAIVTALVLVGQIVDVGRSELMHRDSWFLFESRHREGCPSVSPWWKWKVVHEWCGEHCGHPHAGTPHCLEHLRRPITACS